MGINQGHSGTSDLLEKSKRYISSQSGSGTKVGFIVDQLRLGSAREKKNPLINEK